MTKLGLLFLPSGPGLSPGPARIFLNDTFNRFGESIFWSESSAIPGSLSAMKPREVWDALFESIRKAVEKLPPEFVIVTESFGSLLAEEFIRRHGKKFPAGRRLLGILHTPPVMNLGEAYRTILLRGGKAPAALTGGEIDFRDPAFILNLDLALANPAVLPAYFRKSEEFAKWAAGFSKPEDAPRPDLRNAILFGMAESGARTEIVFDSNVPTWVCVGAHDPYRPMDFRRDDDGAKWFNFEESSHYPFVDEFPRWVSEVFEPFVRAVKRRPD